MKDIRTLLAIGERDLFQIYHESPLGQESNSDPPNLLGCTEEVSKLSSQAASILKQYPLNVALEN